MSSMMPPELMAALQGGAQGGGQPGGYGQDDGGSQSPLDVLQECINSLPALIHSLPDPRDTQDAVKALLILTGIQTRLMQGNGQPGQQGG